MHDGLLAACVSLRQRTMGIDFPLCKATLTCPGFTQAV